MSDYLIAFWNVENLFAQENYADRIDWVRADVARDLEGWSVALYNKKRDQSGSIIQQMKGGDGPDILGVCEVEDRKVLNDLAATCNALLPNRSYDVIHATNDLSSRGIDTAFLFDSNAFSVESDLVFNHFVMRRTGTRDILQATFKLLSNDKEIVVMANHWPSRFGGNGARSSAGFRATAAETLAYWHGQIFKNAPKLTRTPVIAFGDMNDDPWDDSMIFNAIATRERGDVERARSAKFYNMTWEYMLTAVKDLEGSDRLLEGSLYYKGNGNLFDQILVNKPLLDENSNSEFKIVNGTAGLITFPEMVSKSKGEGPRRFGLPKGDVAKNIDETGFSDHFPIGVTVTEV